MKRILSIIFILVMNINTFAAIVSDNDGSAFITKSEFDSLKNNFQKQIDNYYTSIDSKIDGTIAEYLSGLKQSYTIDNYYDSYIANVGHKPIWYNSFKTGVSSWTNDVSITTTLNHTVDNANNIQGGLGAYRWSGSDTRGVFAMYAGTAPTGNQAANAKGAFVLSSSESGANFSTTQYIWGALNDVGASGTPAFTYAKEDYDEVTSDVISTGVGNGWEWQIINGRRCLKKFNDNFYYQQKLDIYMHSSCEAHDRTYYLSDNMKGNPTTHDVTVDNKATPLGTSIYGTTKEKDKISTSQYGEVNSSKVRNNDGINYLDYLWSIDSDTTLYGTDEEKVPTYLKDETYTVKDGKFYNIYYTADGAEKQTNTLAGGDFTYSTFSFQPDSYKMSEFYSDIESTIAGEPVKNGGGMILLSSTADRDVSVKIKIKLASKSGDPKNCSVKLSKKQFDIGDFKNTSDSLYDKTITTGTEVEIPLNISSFGSAWIWLKNTTDTDPITIDLFEIL